MIRNLYCYFDSCAGTYSLFGEFVNDACALRAFKDACKDLSVPSDYSLYNFGYYDSESGEFNLFKNKFIFRGEKE